MNNSGDESKVIQSSQGGMSVSNVEYEEDPDRGRKVITLGLAWKTDEPTLREYFSKYGNIQEVDVLIDKKTNKSRGFAFIIYSTAEEAKMSVGEHIIDGRIVQVEIARPRTKKPPKTYRGREINRDFYKEKGVTEVRERERESMTTNRERNFRRGSPGLSDGKKLFCGKLPVDIRVSDLRDYFSKFGNVDDCYIPTHRITGNPRGFGFVTFFDKEVVYRVLNTQKHIVMGKEIVVDVPAPKGIDVSNQEGRNRGGRYNSKIDSARTPRVENQNALNIPQMSLPQQQMMMNQQQLFLQQQYYQQHLLAQGYPQMNYNYAYGVNPDQVRYQQQQQQIIQSNQPHQQQQQQPQPQQQLHQPPIHQPQYMYGIMPNSQNVVQNADVNQVKTNAAIQHQTMKDMRKNRGFNPY